MSEALPGDISYNRLLDEFDHISSRLNWLLSSQAFLFAAYSTLISSEAFGTGTTGILSRSLAYAGLGLCFTTFLGVFAAYWRCSDLVKRTFRYTVKCIPVLPDSLWRSLCFFLLTPASVALLSSTIIYLWCRLLWDAPIFVYLVLTLVLVSLAVLYFVRFQKGRKNQRECSKPESLIRERLKQEYKFSSERVSWAITSNAFLVAALVTCLTSETPNFTFAKDLTQAGLTITGASALSLISSTLVQCHLHLAYQRYVAAQRTEKQKSSLVNKNGWTIGFGNFSVYGSISVLFLFWALLLPNIISASPGWFFVPWVVIIVLLLLPIFQSIFVWKVRNDPECEDYVGLLCKCCGMFLYVGNGRKET